MADKYCIYLRKSRMDLELEKRGEGETLARHRAALVELAKKLNLNVVKIYQEVVSGESIVSRPQMQELMRDVENGSYDGVLVMEIERLARGDTMDQGLVAQTFKYSGTKIITPLKTYDPNDEYDEEFFEFGLFMSRREYKTINRRLKRGLYASAKEGKWLSPKAPYGYRRVPLTDRKGTTLEPIEDQAAVIRMIFDLYVNGLEGRRYGIQAIAHRLNELGIPAARRDYWQKETIRDILNNPVYAGKIRYGYRRSQKKIVNGERVIYRPISYDENCIIAEGLHPAIISAELYDAAQKYSETRPIMPVGYKKEIKNPMAGLIICKLCGRKMSLRKSTTANKPDYLVCHARSCTNVSSPLFVVENKLIKSLEAWVKQYEFEISAQNESSSAAQQIAAVHTGIEAKKKELETLQKQLSNTYDLLEQGVYTVDVFRERSGSLTKRIGSIKADIEHLGSESERIKHREKLRKEFVPHVKSVLQAYKETDTAPAKNELLREVLEKATYHKAKSAAYSGVDIEDFELEIYPKLPENK